jgi:uncharacterized protein YdeI (YjbR/CyaY-like superfamily)
MAGGRRLEDRPRVEPSSRAEWRAWLEANHETSGAVWLVTRKKAAGDVPLTQAEAIEEALAFGWIDSLPRKLDEARTMLLLAPRKPAAPGPASTRTGWSACWPRAA